ncbi:MAG TPA: hypothetical protein VIU15_44545 [Streptomyces sp.]
MRDCVRGLLGLVGRENGRQPAECADHATPDGLQRLLAGSWSKTHKGLVHRAFEEKIGNALRERCNDTADWSGVHAIIESIVHAFD